MKELSIEEKANLYDEALERYKAKQEYESKEVHKFIEYIFPELAGSKDERIRKALIEGLREMKNSFNTISSVKIDDAIAWLKKQGKQRYTWKPSDKQMEILWKYAEQNNYDGMILTSLYNDLKKLKG